MKVMFVMAYPGYLRYFDSTIRELGARGHAVELWFEGMNKQAEGLQALDTLGPAVSVGGVLPGHYAGLTKRLALDLRRVMDFVRYLDPIYANADYLRDRVGAALPPAFGFLRRFRTLPRPLVRTSLRLLLAADGALPRAQAIDALLTDRDPDVLVVTPLVMVASRQADVVASARAAGIPVAVAVASWDHLTTKGMIRGNPDRVIVWNDAQRREAVELHFRPGESVRVTGAQPFDRWFEREPSPREHFCRRVGIPADRPYVLFVGSTASISHPDAEIEFVRTWAEAISNSGKDSLHDVQIVIRPHPYNSSHWLDADLGELKAVVWPRRPTNPTDEQDRADYFDSLHHASAVVGINTSAMIEAAIVGTPVLTIATPMFNDTQAGTVHFGYLLPENGGFVQSATTLEEHLEQVAGTLAQPEETAGILQRFVASFVRPQTDGMPSTSRVADAIEETAALQTAPWSPPLPQRVIGRSVLMVISVSSARDLVRDRPRFAKVVRRAMKQRRRKTLESAQRWETRLYHTSTRLRSRSSKPVVRVLASKLDRLAPEVPRIANRVTARVERRVNDRLAPSPAKADHDRKVDVHTHGSGSSVAETRRG